MNKKGSLFDIIFVAVAIFFFSLVIIFGYKIHDAINTEIQDNVLITAEGKAAASKLNGYYPTVIDDSFLFFAIGIGIVTLALAALVRVHPVFIIFYIIGLVIVIILSGIFSNVYQSIEADANMASIASQLVFTHTLMQYLPIVIGVFGTMLAIIMYKGWKDEN